MRERKTSVKQMNKMLYKHSPVKKNVKYHEEDDPVSNVTKVARRIYLGNYKAAKDKNFFKDNNIKAVLNCTREKDVRNYFPSAGVEYMRIPVDDSLEKKDFNLMFEFLPAAIEFIHKHVVLQKNNILIHCVMGRQRSVCCLVGFLMKYHDMSPKQAGEYVVDKRQEAFHHGYSVNFNQTINKFYKDLKKKGVKDHHLLEDELFKRV